MWIEFAQLLHVGQEIRADEIEYAPAERFLIRDVQGEIVARLSPTHLFRASHFTAGI
jgi:hypothetical protein